MVGQAGPWHGTHTQQEWPPRHASGGQGVLTGLRLRGWRNMTPSLPPRAGREWGEVEHACKTSQDAKRGREEGEKEEGETRRDGEPAPAG
eukprot:scaffold6559_cov101-Isochrysis_galbana.AAC.1